MHKSPQMRISAVWQLDTRPGLQHAVIQLCSWPVVHGTVTAVDRDPALVQIQPLLSLAEHPVETEVGHVFKHPENWPCLETVLDFSFVLGIIFIGQKCPQKVAS